MGASVLIVGGGIAGLGTALALKRRGIDAEILESAPEWRTEGSGLFTCANGLAALDELGVGEPARAAGVSIRERRFATHRAATLMQLYEHEIWGGELDSLGITRSALQQVFRDAISDVPITFGCTVTDVDSQPDGVRVVRSDGREQKVDFVVGADGVGSTVRRLTLGTPTARVVEGRGVRWLARRSDGLDAWTAFLGPSGLLLAIPVSDDEVYCYASRSDAPADIDLVEWVAPLRQFAAPLGSLVDARTVDLHESSITEVEIPDCWGVGRVLVIGDAAHGMAPYMAQGGSLALEDALAVARIVSDPGTGVTAAARLTADRAERTAWVQAKNHRRERLAKLPLPVAKLGLRIVGKRSWIADLAPLSPLR